MAIIGARQHWIDAAPFVPDIPMPANQIARRSGLSLQSVSMGLRYGAYHGLVVETFMPPIKGNPPRSLYSRKQSPQNS